MSGKYTLQQRFRFQIFYELGGFLSEFELLYRFVAEFGPELVELALRPRYFRSRERNMRH